MNMKRQVPIVIGGMIIAAILTFNWIKKEPAEARIIMPDNLSQEAGKGHVAFTENCAACHGTTGQGTDQGPPLIHDIYNPGHHGDVAFYRAARFGVRAHHWPYGNMAPLPQVNETMMKSIIVFVREVQAANGIVSKAHKM